jgi:hypothetical protein
VVWVKAGGPPITSLNTLNLSGGGADGAYGAGLLCGWTVAGTRPSFDVVTGISTGALIAPFAFLGPEYDSKLKDAYTQVTTKDILRPRRPLLLTLVTSDAAADTGPLMKLVTRLVDDQALAAIAREHAKGRRLFIGTTNLDAQRPVIWDMGAIATRGGPEAAKLFRQVMVASASIPVAFPPVFIPVEADGRRYSEMQVDGGTMRQVFHVGSVLQYHHLAELPEATHFLSIPRRAFIIRNSLIRPEWAELAPRMLPIAGRSISTLIKANALGDVDRIYALCVRHGIEFNLAYIPDEFVPQPKEMFDKAEMNRLFQLGYDQAKNGTAWQKAPPGINPEDRLPPTIRETAGPTTKMATP